MLDYIERVSRRVLGPYGHLRRPVPLAPVANLFDEIQSGTRVWALVSTPPQHGKTALELYGAVRYLHRFPEHSVVFASYGQAFSRERSRDARQIARAAGLQLGTDAVDHWRTAKYGGFKATSVEGPLTGDPSIKLIIVDDPFKSRADAESRAYRDAVYNWMTSVVLARAHKDTSIIVSHTRWHVDDLYGRLAAAKRPDGTAEWRVVNLPAIDDAGNALWPELHSLESLETKRRASEYDWWSMYMGSPRPRGGALFQDVTFFDKLPNRYRVSIGVDLAYTQKTHADYSVAVVLAESGGLYYVLDVVRLQVQAPDFAERLKLLASRYPSAPMTSYAYGPERGNIDWLRKQGVRIWAKSVSADKFVRAQPVASEWNRGHVLVPRTRGALDPSVSATRAAAPPEWLDDFTSELLGFTGLHDPHDDQVDALAPAFDRIAPSASASNSAGSGFVRSAPSFEDQPVG